MSVLLSVCVVCAEFRTYNLKLYALQMNIILVGLKKQSRYVNENEIHSLLDLASQGFKYKVNQEAIHLQLSV